jgi:hypothetical protein
LGSCSNFDHRRKFRSRINFSHCCKCRPKFPRCCKCQGKSHHSYKCRRKFHHHYKCRRRGSRHYHRWNRRRPRRRIFRHCGHTAPSFAAGHDRRRSLGRRGSVAAARILRRRTGASLRPRMHIWSGS